MVGCTYQGQPVSRCVYIWVDKDFAMYRGWIQGFPKKLGSVHMTRTYPVGKATPRLEPGARFGATCTAGSREIARAVVTLRGVSTHGPTVNAPPMAQHATLSRLRRPRARRVRAGALRRPGPRSDRHLGGRRRADAWAANTIEPLQAIAPRTIGKGFRFTFAYTVHGGQVLTPARQGERTDDPRPHLARRPARRRPCSTATAGCSAAAAASPAAGARLRAAGRAAADHRDAPHLSQPLRGVPDGGAAAIPVVLHEAARLGLASRRAGGAAPRVPFLNYEGELAVVIGRTLLERAGRTRARVRAAATPSPTTSACTTSATPIAARCSA